ncbi:hypothetical protein B9Y75_00895 [Stenotrophomonas maltophilia]|nr:hypothetical protein B9Y75_00895 [Stenotrophomonas maltophilia]
MDIRLRLICVMLAVAVAGAASGQQIHSARGPAPEPVPAAPKAAHNSMAKTTTPFNCDQYRWPNHPHPGMKSLCDGLEANTLQRESRQAGRPSPSTEVEALPAMGTEAAKRSGVACIGGQSMRRLSNGWEQLRNTKGEWLRCRER